jgi:hypothetical protein
MLIVVPFFDPIITDSFAKVNNRTPGRGLSGGSTSGGSSSGGSSSGGSTSGGSSSGGSGGGGTTTDVINGNNPASASSLLCGSNTITFGSVVQGYGERTAYVNGSSAAGGVGFQAICVGTTAYLYNLYNPEWYQWTGSAWSAIGTAPPGQSGVTAIPVLMGANCCGGETYPWSAWLARGPDYADLVSQGGPAQGYAPSNGGNCCGGYGTGYGFVDITWDSFGASGTCTYPDGYEFPETPAGWSAAALAITNGSQTGAIDGYLTTYILPMAQYIAYIRVAHEWNGNWFCTSPWLNGNESPANLTPAQWMGIQQVMITEFQKLIMYCGSGCNPNIGIYVDAPSDPVQQTYGMTTANMAATGLGPGTPGYANGTCYQGRPCIDMTGSDMYIGSSCAGNACGYSAFAYEFNGGDYYYNKEAGATWAAENNLWFDSPEWADSTSNSAYATGTIITNFVNFFASLNGPGNFKTGAVSYWDQPNVGLGQYPPYQGAYGQAWPNGFYGTSYNRTTGFWATPYPMPCPNFWNAGPC